VVESRGAHGDGIFSMFVVADSLHGAEVRRVNEWTNLIRGRERKCLLHPIKIAYRRRWLRGDWVLQRWRCWYHLLQRACSSASVRLRVYLAAKGDGLDEHFVCLDRKVLEVERLSLSLLNADIK
jgi:hypothetical protein